MLILAMIEPSTREFPDPTLFLAQKKPTILIDNKSFDTDTIVAIWDIV